EVQTAFLAVIDVAMEDEGIDAVEVTDFLVSVSVGGGLKELAIGLVGGVEALFGQDDSAGLAFVEEFGTADELGQLLDVFEGDARSVGRVGRGFVVPGAAFEEIFGVWVEGDVPIEIAAFTRLASKIFDEGAAGEG